MKTSNTKTLDAGRALLKGYVQMKAGNLKEGFRSIHAAITDNTEGVDSLMDGIAQSIESAEADDEYEFIDDSASGDDTEDEVEVDAGEIDEDEYVEIDEDLVEGKCKSKASARKRVQASDEVEEEVQLDEETETDSEEVEVSAAVARVLNLSY